MEISKNFEKSYVSKELAKLLKKNGYNEETQYIYTDEGLDKTEGRINSEIPLDYYCCPSIYDAQQWIASKTGMFSIVYPVYYHGDGVITYRYRIISIYDLYEKKKGKLCNIWYDIIIKL